MYSYNEKLNQDVLKIDNLLIFIFRPEDIFYTMTFADKIKILEEKIVAAKRYLNNVAHNLEAKSIFVAPEYLFKDFSEKLGNRYYRHDEKKLFKQHLMDISLDTDLILAPGTICWKKESKRDKQIYYRNIIYFFHRGDVKKYKKFNSWLSDADYYDKLKGSETFYHHSSKPHTQKSDDNLIEFNGISIGVEICYDNCANQLEKSPLAKNKLLLHLIVAAGLSGVNFLKKNGIITVKVDQNRHFETFSSQNIDSLSTNKNLKAIRKIIEIEANLECHHYQNISILKDSSPTNGPVSNSFYDFENYLKKFDAIGRFELAKSNLIKITSSYELVHVLDSLNSEHRLEYAKLNIAVMTGQFALLSVLETLAAKDRLEYIRILADNMPSWCSLPGLLGIVDEKDRLKFAKDYSHKINNCFDLADVLNTLKSDDRLDFAKMHANKIKNKFGLNYVLEKLDSAHHIEFRKFHDEIIASQPANDNEIIQNTEHKPRPRRRPFLQPRFKQIKEEDQDTHANVIKLA